MKGIYQAINKNPDNPSPQAAVIAANASEILKGLTLPAIESFLYVRIDNHKGKPDNHLHGPSTNVAMMGAAASEIFSQCGTWKQRWCILRDDHIYIVKSPSQLNLIAVLALGVDTQVLPDAGMGTINKVRFRFKVMSSLLDCMEHLDIHTEVRKEQQRISQKYISLQLLMIKWVKALVNAVKEEKVRPRLLIPIQKDDQDIEFITASIQPPSNQSM
jgi:hypothetical protein